MATGKPTTLSLDALHRLTGRMLSHADELEGRPELPPGIARDCRTATDIMVELAEFLTVIAEHLPPGDLPEASRASHYS